LKTVRLNHYDNTGYKPGSKGKRILWYFTNVIFFKTLLPLPSIVKVKLLRVFGAKVGHSVILKPDINIKYPWFLEMGDCCWVGEGVWIDNLAHVKLGDNVVLSQGSYLLTGSHNYKKKSFDLITGKIVIEDGVWIGAKSVVCPGVICKSHSVLSAGSTATTDLEKYQIYQGNPAKPKRSRVIT
jgi:putative colanic acid biosynthesis acetyltransferase WcaF